MSWRAGALLVLAIVLVRNVPAWPGKKADDTPDDSPETAAAPGETPDAALTRESVVGAN